MKFQEGMRCYICGCRLSPGSPVTSTSFTRDHVIPKVSGGNKTQPACRQCNLLKGSNRLTVPLMCILKCIRICVDLWDIQLPKTVSAKNKSTYSLRFRGFSLDMAFAPSNVGVTVHYLSDSVEISEKANSVVNILLPHLKTLYLGKSSPSIYNSVCNELSSRGATMFPDNDIMLSSPAVVGAGRATKTACACCGTLLDAKVAEGVLVCKPCYEVLRQSLNAFNRSIQNKISEGVK